MYNEESSALRTWSCLASLRILLNLLNLRLILTILPICFEGLLNLLTPFASAFAGVAAAGLLAFLVFLAAGAPSISATSTRLLLEPPFTLLDLPGPPGCFFPVTSLF